MAPKKLTFEELTPAHLSAAAELIQEHTHDLEMDRVSIKEEYGVDAVGALKAVVVFLKGQAALRHKVVKQ